MPSMSVPRVRTLLCASLVALLSACGDNNVIGIGVNPSPQPPIVLTVTFSGTITRNSAYTHPFAVGDQGNVSVYLINSADTADPANNTLPLGVSLGTWNGAACAIVIANDQMLPGSPVPLTGRATSAGNLCVRVYDVGYVPAAANYELLIDHY